MPTFTKFLLILGSLLLFGLLGLIIYNQRQTYDRQLAIEAQIVQQKELVDKIVRSQSEYTSKKDLEQFIKDNGVALDAVKKDLSNLKAEVNSFNVVLIASLGQRQTNVASTSVGPANPDPPVLVCKDGTPCPNADPFGYLRNQQNLVLHEDFGQVKLPIGSVGFSAWQQKPWSFDIKAREYNIMSVVGKDENQRSYFYNKVTVKVDDKVYELPIKNAISKQEYPEAKFSAWNPRLSLGVDYGATVSPQLSSELSPNVTVSVMSYGRYKNQPDFMIGGVGVGYDTADEVLKASVTPFTYNVGKHIPLLNNLYVGPTVQVGMDKSLSVVGSVKVGL